MKKLEDVINDAMAWWLAHSEQVLTIAMLAGMLLLLTGSSHG